VHETAGQRTPGHRQARSTGADRPSGTDMNRVAASKFQLTLELRSLVLAPVHLSG
jgi:hypothetical protein